MFVVNNIILNFSIKINYKLATWLWTSNQLSFENKPSIVNSGLLKVKNMDLSTKLIVNNFFNHIEFHSKWFIMIKYVLMNEIINFNGKYIYFETLTK